MSTGRSHEEFWDLSPGQIHFTLRAHGLIRKKGGVRDFLSILGRHQGVKDRTGASP